jgi:hypothetical protein
LPLSAPLGFPAIFRASLISAPVDEHKRACRHAQANNENSKPHDAT